MATCSLNPTTIQTTGLRRLHFQHTRSRSTHGANQPTQASMITGARCSSVVRTFAHGVMGRRIDPSWWTHWAISRSSQWSTTGVTTHFIYGYMASDIWLRTIQIVRKETRCSHKGYSLRITARVLLYAPSHRQDSTYHGLCYTSRGTLAGTRNSSMGSAHEGSIQRPIAPWANALTTELH